MAIWTKEQTVVLMPNAPHPKLPPPPSAKNIDGILGLANALREHALGIKEHGASAEEYDRIATWAHEIETLAGYESDVSLLKKEDK